ncbi:hypothetical protein F4677DRAFT_403607 [Hypoxylon crocopeplum]|nr:hypothetical protein F4677DRAFT_403607 [Hypoxylon crocopeplum]
MRDGYSIKSCSRSTMMALGKGLNDSCRVKGGRPIKTSECIAGTPHFSVFGSLPPELRDMIWDFALPDDIPELYMRPPQPTSTSKAPGESAPLTVCTGFPALMHACREARELATSRIRLRYSLPAQCEIPYRALRPELDIVQISYSGVAALLWLPDFWKGGIATQLQHVAVEANTLTSYMQAQLADSLQYLRNLRTLHVIFMSTTAPLQIGEELIPRHPSGRCTLLPFTRERPKFLSGSTKQKSPEWDLDFLYDHLQELVRTRLSMWGDDVKIAAWDYEKQTLKLQIVAQVMVHYQPFAGSSCWVEIGDA